MADARGTIKRAMRLPAEAMLKVYLAARPRPRFTPERVKRILVFAYHGLGNFIMYTPALRALRERYPEARIDLQVGNNTGCEEVLSGAGLFDNIYNLRYSAGLREWMARAREIRATRYDLIISEFHSHSWPLALLVATSHAPYRLGHVTSPGWPARFSRYSYAFNLPVTMRDDEHEIERYFDLVATVGAERKALDQARPFIHLTDEDRCFAEEFLRAHGCTGEVIGIQPGTSPAMRWKQWPLDRYRQIVERFLAERRDAHVILFGAPNEREMIEEMACGLGARVSVAAGRTTVKQVAALIERCAALVCNDSGLMHTAVAVATPVVAIYGPTDIRRTRPVGEQHTLIRHALPCSPCFRLEGDDAVKACPHHDCLMTIAPDEVHAAIVRMTRAEPPGRLVQRASQPLE
ncbi:MAG: glycosyltransferase family 9 protein [Blastocatellia bacterium]